MSHAAVVERLADENGATVLLETSRALPLVSISIGLKTGAIFDPAGKEGATRLLSRLMRRTGGGLEAQVIDTRIDSLGASVGADVAQSTMVFQATVISRSLDALVDLLVDVLARPGLATAELERLQRETLAELTDSLDDDRGLARRFFRRRFFGEHPYGRSVTGTSKSVPTVTRSDVEGLFKKNFVRGNLVFAFSGDIDAEGASRIAHRISEALPEGAALTDPTPEPVAVPGRRLVIVDKPERTQTQILIGCMGSHTRDEDHVALLVANTIFGGTFTARMTQEVRSKRGWSYGAYSNVPFDRRRQAFTMWTFPKADDAGPCLRLELDMLRGLRENGVTKHELSWAKRYLVRSHAFAVDTAAKRVGLELDQALYDLPSDYYSRYLERVQAVTLEEANLSLQKRLSDRDLLVAVVGTESLIGGAVRDAIDELASTEVVPFDRVE
ncbi:MAG TPA: pitrilysin family protein [Polyangiaceae bacterium]|jgi:zinc protease|nr:pitrilysin family protein [Polyangiaceae bacterium]